MKDSYDVHELYHYGVPGMKWGVRKQPEVTNSVRQRRSSSSGNNAPKNNNVKDSSKNVKPIGYNAAVKLSKAAEKFSRRVPGLRKIAYTKELTDDQHATRGYAYIATAIATAGTIATVQHYKNKRNRISTDVPRAELLDGKGNINAKQKSNKRNKDNVIDAEFRDIPSSGGNSSGASSKRRKSPGSSFDGNGSKSNKRNKDNVIDAEFRDIPPSGGNSSGASSKARKTKTPKQPKMGKKFKEKTSKAPKTTIIDAKDKHTRKKTNTTNNRTIIDADFKDAASSRSKAANKLIGTRSNRYLPSSNTQRLPYSDANKLPYSNTKRLTNTTQGLLSAPLSNATNNVSTRTSKTRMKRINNLKSYSISQVGNKTKINGVITDVKRLLT